jgi:hypothetical protein
MKELLITFVHRLLAVVPRTHQRVAAGEGQLCLSFLG